MPEDRKWAETISPPTPDQRRRTLLSAVRARFLAARCEPALRPTAEVLARPDRRSREEVDLSF
jgi:hypothetical protein